MKRVLAGLAILLTGVPVSAVDMASIPTIGMELARDLTQGAIEVCRDHGWQVSVVVVGKSGDVQAALRDTLAPRHTLEIARRKAEAVILSGVSTADLLTNRPDVAMELNNVASLLLIEGGVPIKYAGVTIGALAVAGAPGPRNNERCALASLSKHQERLDFPVEF
ncbi:MAG: heme-binding protein [Thiobacillus sp.]|nr:heme-binding protein [Thiobacillus sp.]